MQAVITIALPFFALIFTGFGAGKAGLLPQSAVSGLSVFVFYFALPALLLTSIAQSPVAELADVRLLLAWLLPSLALFTLLFVICRPLFGTSRSERAVQALAATFSNVGFVGLPLVVVALGSEAVLPAVVVILVDIVLMIAIATAIIELDQGRSGNLGQILRTVTSGVVRNPVIVASVIGLVLGAMEWRIPGPVFSYLELLGGAAAPAALFALGATLASRPLGEGMRETSFILGVKLFVHPLVVWGVATLFGLPPLWTAVLVIQASLPIAANVYVLAQRYQTYVVPASSVIFWSTAVSVFTVSAVVLLFVGD
ncbi:MAG: AEC family transporter [Ectothiorhodospiraceae bacterium]|nr:AEC family transporter [Ectothiorhodospiraceae bacterium]